MNLDRGKDRIRSGGNEGVHCGNGERAGAGQRMQGGSARWASFAAIAEVSVTGANFRGEGESQSGLNVIQACCAGRTHRFA